MSRSDVVTHEWGKQAVRIAVNADTFGPLALTPNLNNPVGGYTVTHLETGFAMSQVLPQYFLDKDDLRDFVEAVILEMPDIDNTLTKHANGLLTKDEGQALVKHLLAIVDQTVRSFE